MLNGALLGVYTATFVRHDLTYEWWAWILPHGVTELLAIVLSAGGGLYIGYTILVPGRQTRAQALAAIRGRLVYFVVFVFPMFLVAAAIESFLRQSNLSNDARYIFAFASVAFWVAYLGFVAPPAALRERHERQKTLTEARVGLPGQDELVGFF